jgi:acetoin:2,6-dichlorophenolindophenol oxidoreductase subunit alpha
MPYSKEFLAKLYMMMKRIRLFEESLVQPIIAGEIRCPVHLYSGEEAIATGVCAALEEEDYLFGNHRSHGHLLAKGGDMNVIMAEIYGRATGCSKGRGGSMHLIDPGKNVIGVTPIVSGAVPLAVGAALASKIKKERRVTVAFFGDGATGEGGLYEAMNFASLKHLPVVFICENNLYSTHLPVNETRSECKIYEIAKPFNIESHSSDGNLVLTVYENACNAIEKCREGYGPVFLEFITFRFRGHVGPSDTIQGTHRDIRPKDQIAAWKKRDPIILFRNYLLENEIISENDIYSIDQKCESEVNKAKAFATGSKLPDKKDLLRYVFTE